MRETNYDTWLTDQNAIDEFYGDEHYRQEREEKERLEEIKREQMWSNKDE